MTIDWIILIYQVLGGLALFLFGMDVMTKALKESAGSKLKQFLHNMTSTRWKGLIAGTSITAIIQSSSVTTVLIVGFVSAGIMSFESTLAVILGADIGTTITAQIIAFKITKIALALIIIGYLFTVISHHKNKHELGKVLLGLGLIFLGMNYMGDGMHPLKVYPPFINTMHNLSNPVLGIAIGTLFTAIIQSSSATTGIVIILASQNLITCEGGISIIIGANIGTCITAFLSTIGKPKIAIQVAIAHISFKITGALIWVWFIPQLAILTENISPTDLPRQIANAHTIFNVSNALLLIGITKPFALLINKIFPIHNVKDENEILLLNKYYLQHTGLAIDLVEKELLTFSTTTKKLLDNALPTILYRSHEELIKLRASDSKIDLKQKQILSYLQQIQQAELKKKDVVKIKDLMELTNIFEAAADLITTDMVEAAEHRIKHNFQISNETSVLLDEIYKISINTLHTAFLIYQSSNKKQIAFFNTEKKEFKKRMYVIKYRLSERLSIQDKTRISIIRFETELIELISQLFFLANRIKRM